MSPTFAQELAALLPYEVKENPELEEASGESAAEILVRQGLLVEATYDLNPDMTPAYTLWVDNHHAGEVDSLESLVEKIEALV